MPAVSGMTATTRVPLRSGAGAHRWPRRARLGPAPEAIIMTEFETQHLVLSQKIADGISASAMSPRAGSNRPH